MLNTIWNILEVVLFLYSEMGLRFLSQQRTHIDKELHFKYLWNEKVAAKAFNMSDTDSFDQKVEYYQSQLDQGILCVPLN